jgi:hypothetical protein
VVLSRQLAFIHTISPRLEDFEVALVALGCGGGHALLNSGSLEDCGALLSFGTIIDIGTLAVFGAPCTATAR